MNNTITNTTKTAPTMPLGLQLHPGLCGEAIQRLLPGVAAALRRINLQGVPFVHRRERDSATPWTRITVRRFDGTSGSVSRCLTSEHAFKAQAWSGA